jgi:hypothetical protein
VLSGALTVRDRTVKLDLPVGVVERGAGELMLAGRAVIQREPLGLSPLGMIRGPAEVGADLMLTPVESPNSGDDRSHSRHPDSAGTLETAISYASPRRRRCPRKTSQS